MSGNADLVSSINYATMQINRHVAALMLLFGTVGNLLNIWVLNEHSLHQNTCSIYLCWSSVSGVVFLWSALLTRVLQGYNVNWPNQNDPLCKIRLFLLSVAWASTVWCLVGANIDRYLCSCLSATRRQFSTSRVARRYVIGVFIFFVLAFAESFYCYEASVPNVPVACYGRSFPCRIYNDWFALFVDIIFPSIFLFIFGTLTIRNVRSRVVHPVTNVMNQGITTNNRLPARNNDRTLTRMLLIQVLMVLVLDLPFGVYRPYASLTSDITKSAYRVAIENLSYAVVILLVFFTHSTSFYLYTLTGALYRAAFKRIVKRCFNRVRPTH